MIAPAGAGHARGQHCEHTRQGEDRDPGAHARPSLHVVFPNSLMHDAGVGLALALGMTACNFGDILLTTHTNFMKMKMGLTIRV